jgi:membrane dipeptidase
VPVEDPLPSILVNGSDASLPSTELLRLQHESGVDAVLLNGFGDYDDVHKVLQANESFAIGVAGYQDVLDAHRAGKLAVILGWQSADKLSVGAGVDWGFHGLPQLDLDKHHRAGLRVVNFAYNLANQFGGGCLDDEVGLTRSGVYLQTALEEAGILIDTGGHTGRRTALDMAHRARKPLICSHGNVRALNPNARNLHDDVMRAIADTGGVIGVAAAEALLLQNAANTGRATGPATLDRLCEEFDYMRDLVGIDHVGLGPDFVHGKHMPYGLGRSMIFPPDMIAPQDPLRFVAGFESIDKIGNVRSALARRGWSDVEIRKVMGQNWLRVYRAAWT